MGRSIEFGEFNAAFLSAVQAAKKAGKTQEQAIAEFTLPAKFKDYQMTGTKDNVPKNIGRAEVTLTVRPTVSDHSIKT